MYAPYICISYLPQTTECFLTMKFFTKLYIFGYAYSGYCIEDKDIRANPPQTTECFYLNEVFQPLYLWVRLANPAWL